MLPVVQVKLNLALAMPLVEMLRQRAAALNEAGAPDGESAEAWVRRETSLREVRQLLALFEPTDFSDRGVIILRQHLAAPVARASAFLRFDLRRTALAGLSDRTMESGLDPEAHSGEEHRAIMSYLFLATLQDLALKHFDLQPSLPTIAWRTGRKLTAWVRSRFGGSSGSWQVVVHNDPVNTMPYVTTVFRNVVGLAAPVAEKHMREVHEAKRSVIWAGSREMAETHARGLRSWHLTAETQSSG